MTKRLRKNNFKVFVAMSGGVDSSVAAALLRDQGYDVVGITMCFPISGAEPKRPSCGGLENIEDAKRAADILGIPHKVLDSWAEINNLVITNFCFEYLSGRTPNPCIRCNQLIKFGTLYRRVRALGADFLATGHYVKKYRSATGDWRLKQALDRGKDQSYFLYALNRNILPHLLFPLGNLLKSDVRRLARRYRLNTFHKKESQDICFIPRGGYKQFILDMMGPQVMRPGPFKDPHGKTLGEHRGIFNYTIGQRDKLGLALGYPAYVYRIDPHANTVYVGPLDCLNASGLTAEHCQWLVDPASFSRQAVQVKIRYNAPAFKGSLKLLSHGRAQLVFAKQQRSVTPGQSVVFYCRNTLLGGGLIKRAESSPIGP